MDEADLARWRDRLRISFFEQMIIQHAFLVEMSTGRLSLDEAEQSIMGGLDETLAQSEALFGAFLKDPALTVLYGDEVKTVADQIKERVSLFATYLRERDF
jgi:hypothetical protein